MRFFRRWRERRRHPQRELVVTISADTSRFEQALTELTAATARLGVSSRRATRVMRRGGWRRRDPLFADHVPDRGVSWYRPSRVAMPPGPVRGAALAAEFDRQWAALRPFAVPTRGERP